MSDLNIELISNNFSSEQRLLFAETIDAYNPIASEKRRDLIFASSKSVYFPNVDDTGLRRVLRFILSEAPVKIDLILPNMLAYGEKVLGISDFSNKDRLNYFFMLEPFYRKEIGSAIKAFAENYKHVKIANLNFGPELQSIFEILGFETIEDLAKQNVNSIMTAAYYDLPRFINVIDPSFEIPSVQELIGVVLDTRVNSESQFDTSSSPQDVTNSINETQFASETSSEEICDIEYIEKYALTSYDDLWRQKYGVLLYYVIKSDKLYLTFDDCKKILGQDYLLYLALMYCWSKVEPQPLLVIDTNYYIIFDVNVIKQKDILRSISSFLPKNPSTDNHQNYSKTEQAVIENKQKSSSAHKSKRIDKRVIDAVNVLFPKGYRIGSDEDFDRLVSYMDDKYGIEEGSFSQHGVSNMIQRSGEFVQCDRGTYKSIYHCPRISDTLYQRIIDFIDNYSQSTIYYDTIYDNFKNVLNSYNIDNKFLFKGLFDTMLPSYLHSKRNYIVNTKWSDSSPSTANGSILNVMRGYNSIFSHDVDLIFSLDDLKNTFGGVADYVFYNLLYAEEENGLLFLSNKRFVYAPSLSFSDDDINELRDFTENTFKDLGVDIISSRLLYSRLVHLNKPLLNRLNDELLDIIDDDFSLFSLMKWVYASNYAFDRPFISKNFDIKLTAPSVVAYFLRDKPTVSVPMIRSTADRYSININVNIDKTFTFLSKTHVLVDSSNMVKKERFSITDSELNEIYELIDQYIGRSRDGSIKTNQLDYSLFPTLRYRWNSHLLAGIIRTYLDDKFEVKKDSKILKEDNYIVRRKEHE